MGDPPVTRASLLVRLRDMRDSRSWAEFVDLYGPLVYRFARASGVQDADAVDLVQEVMGAVAVKMPEFAYDPARGSFRGWLFTVARRAMIRASRQHPATARGAGGTDAQLRLAEFPGEDVDAQRWDREYEQYLLDRAAAQVREEFEHATWQAFWRTAVAGESPADVAPALGITIVAVYNAKSRVQKRLKQVVSEIRCD